MNVKVIYTLNDKDQSPCLHRLPQPQPVNVVNMDDGSRLGGVDLKSCVEEVLKVSPELLPKLKEHDHAVYAYDYSEEDVPTVGQGKLSAILSQDCLEEEAKQIIGRIMKNPTALFNKRQAAETLEIKLKFVALPSDSPLKRRAARPQQPLTLDTAAAPSSFVNRLRGAYDQPNHSSPQLGLSSSPAPNPDEFLLFSQHNSPASMSQHELEMCLNSPVLSPTMAKANVAMELPQQVQSRPPSRMSAHGPTPPASIHSVDPRDISQGDDGPARKRARLEQTSRPRTAAAFGTQPRDAPLRRTASTTASIRHFRPHLSGAAPQETDGSNRAPTPRPQRLRDAAPRRMSSMSTLRQSESFEVSVVSSPVDPTSPENNPSPAFTSSPPLRDFEVYDEGQQDEGAFCSSPLPPYGGFDETTFGLNDFSMDFSDLPDMPSSESDLHVDIQLGSGPIRDSGIGMMSDEQIPSITAKASGVSQSNTVQQSAFQASVQAHDNTIEPQPTDSRRGSMSVPNQKTQAEFAPGEHPLYHQRTTKLAWNSYEPQGGPALYVQTKPSQSKSKAASAAAWRNKAPRPVKQSSATPMPMSSTPAPSSPMPHDPNFESQHSRLPPRARSQTAWSPADSETSPTYTVEPQYPQSMHMQSNAPTPPETGQAQARGRTSPSNRGRSALKEVSGNSGKVAIPRASTPKPIAPAPTSQAWTPGSKTGTKRKRTASKAPAKSTKDKETPSGRQEKRMKHAPKPLTNENGERIYCVACGAIESSAWRNLWSKCFPGPDSPARLFRNEEKVHIHANVDASGQPDKDENGGVRWWTVHKKSLTKDEMESESWFLQKQCNPCGVYFNQTGQLKIPDWQSLAKRDGVQQSAEVTESQSEQRSTQVIDTEDQAANAPIDLTTHDGHALQADADDHNNDRSAPAQYDELFDEPVQDNVTLYRTNSASSVIAEQASEPTTVTSEKRHSAATSGPDAERPALKNAASNSSLMSVMQSDKENVPPRRITSPTKKGSPAASNMGAAFDDLAVESLLNDHAADTTSAFDDMWAEGLENFIWPGESHEEALEMVDA